MEPAQTFNMTLRGYQKQALWCVLVVNLAFVCPQVKHISWMHSLESGKMDIREASSMHPLWSE